MGIPTKYELSARQVVEFLVAGAKGTIANNTANTTLTIVEANALPSYEEIHTLPKIRLVGEDDRYYIQSDPAYSYYGVSDRPCEVSVFPEG